MENWDRFFNEFYPAIYRYTHSRLRDREAAEDITQEVFLKIAKNYGQYDKDRGNLHAWVWQIVRNAYTDFLRSRGRKKENTESYLDVDLDASPTREHNIYASDDIERIMKIVENFPEDDQELFRLRFISEFSYPEIAEVTGRTVNAVGVALHRIRERIKNAYDRKN